MKIFITGANGLLGQHLVATFLQTRCEVIATGRASNLPFPIAERMKYYQADLTDSAEMTAIIDREKPGLIIHAAAMTNVDDCEKQPGLSSKVNVNATAGLVALATKHGSHLVYISTDFVFEGTKGGYRENDERKPVNHYGLTKMQAEDLVRDASIPITIIRTCLVYGNMLYGNRTSLVSWVKEKLQQQEKIRVVDDQLRTPTSVDDLVAGIMLAVTKRAAGIFHISGADILTPYQMAMETVSILNLDPQYIEKAKSDSFAMAAKRPAVTTMDITKAVREMGYAPRSFSERLREMLAAPYL